MLDELTTTCQIIAHWELYRMVQNVPGTIVECGVFRGRTLLRFAYFRQIFGDNRQLIGFDTFGKFPEAEYELDRDGRADFIANQGDGYTVKQIKGLLNMKDCWYDVSLVEGDIRETVPEFIRRHPDTQIALLNMDTDLYEPAQVILKYFYPLISLGGILIADDYKIFPGETKAVDEFCFEQKLEVNRLPLFLTYYIKK